MRFHNAANSMRGLLGLQLDDRIFRPRLISGPSGLVTPPPPFVLRARHLNSRVLVTDDRFHIDVIAFDRVGDVAAAITRSFAKIEGAGFQFEHAEVFKELAIDLSAPEPTRFALIRFISPTELKGAGEVARTVPFGLLFARVRDRIATLSRLYGDGPLEADFRGLGIRAAMVHNGPQDHLVSRSECRRSSRTGQVHGIGGLVGEIEYEGDLAEFVPWLRAAEWTGIGRHTVWGNGQIECEFRN